MGQPRQAGQKGRGGETDMKSSKCVEWCQKLSLFSTSSVGWEPQCLLRLGCGP